MMTLIKGLPIVSKASSAVVIKIIISTVVALSGTTRPVVDHWWQSAIISTIIMFILPTDVEKVNDDQKDLMKAKSLKMSQVIFLLKLLWCLLCAWLQLFDFSPLLCDYHTGCICLTFLHCELSIKIL